MSPWIYATLDSVLEFLHRHVWFCEIGPSTKCWPLVSVNAREHLRNKSDGVVSIHLSHLSPRSGTYNTGSDLQPSTAVQKARIPFTSAFILIDSHYEQQSNELAITVETEVSRKTDKYGEYEKSKWVYHDGSFDRRFDSWWNLDMGDQGSMARAPCRCQLLFQARYSFWSASCNLLFCYRVL